MLKKTIFYTLVIITCSFCSFANAFWPFDHASPVVPRRHHIHIPNTYSISGNITSIEYNNNKIYIQLRHDNMDRLKWQAGITRFLLTDNKTANAIKEGDTVLALFCLQSKEIPIIKKISVAKKVLRQ